MCGRGLFAALVVGLIPAAVHSELIVNPPRPITHRVTVQLIQTALDNGSSPATVFGNATQRADVEAGIDTIWAQAGIDVALLPDLVRYNDTFAYQGNAGSDTRPQGDLNTIRNNARDEGGILNADSSVLNMFFVNVVPGFQPLSENSAAGLASIAANGIAAYTGDNLLGFAGGRDVIASVMAHEIGHNLGLNHTASGGANLMSPSGTSVQLTDAQINTVFSCNQLPQAAAGRARWRLQRDAIVTPRITPSGATRSIEPAPISLPTATIMATSTSATTPFGNRTSAIPAAVDWAVGAPTPMGRPCQNRRSSLRFAGSHSFSAFGGVRPRNGGITWKFDIASRSHPSRSCSTLLGANHRIAANYFVDPSGNNTSNGINSRSLANASVRRRPRRTRRLRHRAAGQLCRLPTGDQRYTCRSHRVLRPTRRLHHSACTGSR